MSKILALISIISVSVGIFTGETLFCYIGVGIGILDSVVFILSKERK